MNNSRSTTAIVLGVFIALILISCKSSRTATASAQASNTIMTHLTEADKDKTITVQKGQKVELSLRHPGDGGYAFDELQLNAALLKLDSHIHNPPSKDAQPGNFGNDVWIFSTIGTGQADLNITASRSWEKGIKSNMFSCKLDIK